MKTDTGNAEEQASELCESVNWCRSREKGRILVEFVAKEGGKNGTLSQTEKAVW